ncbi:hypothetical protein CLE01_09340 [Cryobacterium levicorallinum]|nr:hypothetical protein CLE01_09340 [Cryobacterium levicorallinum]
MPSVITLTRVLPLEWSVERTWITHRSPQLGVQLLRRALGHRPGGDDDLVVSDGRGDIVPAGSDRQVVGIADSGQRGETARDTG